MQQIALYMNEKCATSLNFTIDEITLQKVDDRY